MGKLFFVLVSTCLCLAAPCHGMQPLNATERRQLEREARLVVDFMQNGHESGRLFRELDNREILTTYMNGLDADADYLLKDDIDFIRSRFGRTLRSVYLFKGDLQPAFEIFETFAKRVQERTTWAEQRLSRGFTFTEDETTSPSNKTPAANAAEADLRWESKLKAEVLAEILRGATEKEATDTVAKRYVQTRRHVMTMDSLAVRERFFDSLLQTFDPHSGYFSADSTREFHLEMSGAVAGIGLDLKKENGLCLVADVKPGGPADLTTELRPGDVIEAYGEPGNPPTSTKGKRLREIVTQIRGKPGTKLALAYRHPGETDTRSCTLERAVVVSIENRARGILYQVPTANGKSRNVGLIWLPGFYANEDETGKTSATQDVLELLRQMRTTGLDGLVIDLRNNGGGALTEARALSGLFIPKGLIMLSRGLDGKTIEHLATESAERYDGPLVVLTSERSASASEIFSGAMKFHRRALIVGSPATFGKGSVQNYIELAKTSVATPADAETWGTLRLTQERYYQPNGRAVQCAGIAADIVLPQQTFPDFRREVAMPHALPADNLSPPATAVPYPGIVNSTTPELIAKLDRVTQENIAHLPEWSLWQHEKKLIESLTETNSESLQIEKRRAAHNAIEASLIALRNERRQLSVSLAWPARNIEIDAVQLTLDAHRKHLLQPPTEGSLPAGHHLVSGGFLFKTDQDKPRLLWLEQFEFRRFLGDASTLAIAFSEASGTTITAQQMRQALQAIDRLENTTENDVLTCLSRQAPSVTTPSALREGLEAMLLRMTELDGDLRRHSAALDVQAREALRLAASWANDLPSASATP
ncbi:MAG: carboxy terminal-processing peptidase [Nibricoccus sp.]